MHRSTTGAFQMSQLCPRGRFGSFVVQETNTQPNCTASQCYISLHITLNNHTQPIRLLLWKWTLRVNKEVKHKYSEVKQRSALQSSHYYVFALLRLLNTQAFTCLDPAIAVFCLMSTDRLD